MADDEEKVERLEPPPEPAAEAPTPVKEKRAEAALPDYDALVEKWWQCHFPNSALARDTKCWNLALKAKEDLKKRLKGE